MTTKRLARTLMWIDPDDCEPPHGLDMGGFRDAIKVEKLRLAFRDEGFDSKEPALIGYPLNGRIQLLSGTHRHLAARQAGILLPVAMWLRSDIEETWATELWEEIMRDIPVRELERMEVAEGAHRSPYDPVSPDQLPDTQT